MGNSLSRLRAHANPTLAAVPWIAGLCRTLQLRPHGLGAGTDRELELAGAPHSKAPAQVKAAFRRHRT
jgi:hypothetical protein